MHGLSHAACMHHAWGNITHRALVQCGRPPREHSLTLADYPLNCLTADCVSNLQVRRAQHAQLGRQRGTGFGSLSP